jgi:hypothetical protein
VVALRRGTYPNTPEGSKTIFFLENPVSLHDFLTGGKNEKTHASCISERKELHNGSGEGVGPKAF